MVQQGGTFLRFCGEPAVAWEQAWQHSFSRGCWRHDWVCNAMQVYFTLIHVVGLPEGDSRWPAVVWVVVSLACSGATAASMTLTRAWYLQNRTVLQLTNKVLRMAAYWITTLSAYHPAYLHRLPQTTAALAMSLLLKNATMGATSLHWQLPYAESYALSLSVAIITAAATFPRCAMECASPVQAQGYGALAAALERWANGWIPLAAINVWQYTTDAMPCATRCAAVHILAQITLGHLLPMAVLHVAETASRTAFLLDVGVMERFEHSFATQVVLAVVLLPLQAAVLFHAVTLSLQIVAAAMQGG